MKEGTIMSRSIKGMAIVCMALLVTAGAAMAGQTTLTWTAGGSGGGWYSMAGGMSNIIKEIHPDIIIKVVPGGGIKNPAVIGSKAADIGWCLPFTNAAAIKGMAPYKKKTPELRALIGGMAPNLFHFYVDDKSPLTSMDQVFDGKHPVRLAVTQPGSSDRWVFERILEGYGTSVKQLKKNGYHFALGNYSFQSNSFKDGNVDGVMTFLAIPGASIIEASIGRKLRLMDFSPATLDHLSQFGILSSTIPAGTYPKAANGDKEITTAVAASVITVHKDMSDDLAYRITKALNDNLVKVKKTHSSLKTYTVEQGVLGCGAELHPGAVRYYKEKGILN